MKAARLLAQASAELATANTDQVQFSTRDFSLVLQDKLVNASKAAADSGRQLLEKSYAAAINTDNDEVAEKIRMSAQSVVSSMSLLLGAVKDQNTTGIAQQEVN